MSRIVTLTPDTPPPLSALRFKWMSPMDELLSFLEEDFNDEEDSFGTSTNSTSDNHPPSTLSGGSRSQSQCKAGPSSTSFKSPQGKKQDLTFKDVFGSPDKRDVKEFGLSSSSTASIRQIDMFLESKKESVKKSLLPSSQLQLDRAIRLDNKVPFKPETGLVVIDPYSRVRVVKSSISIYFDETVSAEAVLKDRNIGLEFVSLQTFPAWQRGKGKDAKNFWVSGVLIRKTSGVRKSAKGNDYSIWDLSDLRDLEKKVTVFLFGTASSASNLQTTPVGALVDITTPSVMPDTSGGGAIKLSINNASQVRFIATAKDFGFCEAKKKNGDKCTAVVNTWECSFCIHHASGELKKLNIGKGKGKSNTKAKNSFFPNKTFSVGESQESLKQQGVVISNFGAPNGKLSSGMNQSFGGNNSNATPKTQLTMPPRNRMELQGPNNEMSKNSVKFGNAESITFVKNGGSHPLLKNEKIVLPPRKRLDLNPLNTRHLSDKDRDLLRMLDPAAASASPSGTSDKPEEKNPSGKEKGGAPLSDLIASSIVTDPNAGSRNFLQFLTLQHAPKDQVDLSSNTKSTGLQPITMSREKLKSMAKALDFVKKNGPIQKADPNGNRKRKFHQLSPGESSSLSSRKSEPSTKKRAASSTKIDVEFDFGSDEFKKILNAKSAHDDELDEIQHKEYFEKLEKKEALENKLLNTYSIETNAVMCRLCKYVALSQSEFCKEQMHEVRLVKAKKRFFKCKDCGNRTMSLDRLPKRPCSNCNNSSWLVAPVGKEKKGPTLPSEMLAVRGNEEKFIGSAGTKMFLHLEV